MADQKLNVGLITTVSGRWPRELPKQRDNEYARWLTDCFEEINLVKNETIAVNNQEVEEIARSFKRQEVDLVIVLLGAFTGDYASAFIAEELNVPVILWAPHEPPFDGGRIMSNALVAATMNAAALHRLGCKYHFIYGDYNEERVRNEVFQYIRIYRTIKKLKNTFLGLIGYRPTSFYSSTFDETLIRQKFGIKMEEFDLSMVLEKARAIDQSKVDKDMKHLESTVNTESLPEGHLENHCRLTMALEEFVEEQGFNALSLKCWPELGNLKFTPCALIARFADKGFVIGCESDVDATLTMLIQKYLTDKITFMSDLINIDEKENTALFWHCGQAATSLKDPKSDLIMSDHPLAGQGAVFETTLKSGKVTIARMSKIGNAYKLFLTRGEAVPTQKVVTGVMVNVVLEDPVLKTVYRIAEEGVPHHYAIVWEDVVDDMKMLCKILDIEVMEI